MASRISRCVSRFIGQSNRFMSGPVISRSLQPTAAAVCKPHGLTTCLTVNTHFSTATASRSLSDMLKKEIEAEKKLAESQGGSELPLIEGWTIDTNDATVTLTKTHNNEKVSVSFNVNHTVNNAADLHQDFNADPAAQHDDQVGVTPSMPLFTVLVNKGSSTLAFECEPVQDEPEHEQMTDADDQRQFDIVEMYVYEGEEPSKDAYITSGGIIDTDLYVQFVDYLGERGITADFVSQLVDLASAHEHKLYLQLLHKIQQHVM